MKIYIIAFLIASFMPNSHAMDVLGDRSCGQIGQPQCKFWVKEYWDMVGFGCDRGLRPVFNFKKFTNDCAAGTRFSANIIRWVWDSLKFQRHLLKDEPIYTNPMIDAHNAIEYSKAGIHLVQNQYYSITDLLNMGVRILSPDIHLTTGNMRAVHCDEAHKYCGFRGRYWAAWLEELKIWIDKNPGEFVIVRIENRNDGDWSNFTKPIEAIMGRGITFTEADLKAGGGGEGIYRVKDTNSDGRTSYTTVYYKKLPSLQKLRDLGKKVAFFTQVGTDGNWTILQDFHFMPGYSHDYIKNFDQKNCIQKEKNLFGLLGESLKKQSWIGISESNAKIGGTLPADWIVDTVSKSGAVDIAAIKAAAACGITDIQMDWVENDRLAAAIWTWDAGEPRNFGSGLNCVKQKNGRWYTANCGESKRFACRYKYSNWQWKVTSGSGNYSSGNDKCASEFGSFYIFDFPNRGDQNETIRRLVGNNQEIWIKYSHGNTNTGGVGTFVIVPQISNRILTGTGDSAIQYGYLGASSTIQRWILTKDAQGFYQIKNKNSNRCLDSFQDNNGGKIGTWACHGGDNQKWELIVKGNDNLSIRNKRSRKCADISGSKKANWDQMMGWDCYNVTQHYYKFYKE